MVDTADLPRFDLLVGGFPCQSYSVSNCNRQGLNCTTGQVIYEVVRFLRECQPAAALLENVPGLLNINDGVDFTVILEALKGAGYRVSWRKINALHFVPQHRVRVYILCVHQDLHEARNLDDEMTTCWPALDHHEPSKLEHSLKDVFEPAATACEALTEEQWAKVIRHEGSPEEARTRRLLTSKPWVKTLTSSYRQDWKYHSQFVERANSTPRFLTPRESLRLMGFPESFKIPSGEGQHMHLLYKQIGNAVVPAVVQAITDQILRGLGM